MTKFVEFLKYVRDKIYFTQPTYVAGYESRPWKKWIFGSIVILFLLFLIGNNQENSQLKSDNNVTRITNKIKAPAGPISSQIKPLNSLNYPVVKVVDGDTIDVRVDGKVQRVRLIGIDTPETVDPRKPIQCFGKEASEHAKTILSGISVSLESDTSQGNTDKYNRLLRYVRLPDGTNFNEKMVKEGYAHEYTYSLPYKYIDEFKVAETTARNGSLGLWADNTCSGNTNQAASTASSVSTSLASQQTAAKPSTAATTQNNDTYYANCTAARAAGAAPISIGGLGYRSALDRDNDGIACE